MTRVSVTHLVLQYKVYKAMTALLLLLKLYCKKITAAKNCHIARKKRFTKVHTSPNGPRGTPWGPMEAIPDHPKAREAMAGLPDNLERLPCGYSLP